VLPINRSCKSLVKLYHLPSPLNVGVDDIQTSRSKLIETKYSTQFKEGLWNVTWQSFAH
jgi:hypothetical protein